MEKGSSYDKGYWEELGRMSAHHNVKQSQERSATMRTNFQAGIVSPQGAIDHTYEGLFGMTAFICEKCYVVKDRRLYERSLQDSRDPSWAPSCISTNRKMKLSKEEYWKSVSQSFPEFLKPWVEAWTAKNPSLSAIMIPESSLKVERVTIVRANQNGTTLSVTLPYSDQDCTKFDVVGLPGWAFKAIRFKHAPLTEEELVDFLRVVKSSTFGFFKLSDKMGLIGTFLLHIQNINYDEKNQREFFCIEQNTVPVKTAQPSSLNSEIVDKQPRPYPK